MNRDNELDNIWHEILDELLRAEKKFPVYPTDVVHATAIMAEESGEAVKASLDVYYGRDNIKTLRKEMIQTAAMCIRFLLGFPKPRNIFAYPAKEGE